MFHYLLGRRLASRTRAARRVVLIVSVFAVAALPHVNAGAWQQQKQVSGKKSGTANAGIDTRRSEKPAAKAVAVKGTDEAQAFAVCAQNQPINFGQTINGTLADGDCSNPLRNNGARGDEYTFNGTAGQQVAISMSSTAFDTYLYLLRADGTVLAENDDIATDSSPPNLNSRIPPDGFIILPSSGTYSILATSFAPESRGAYTLTLTAGANCNSTPIAYGETKQGTLSAGDCTNPIDSDNTLIDLYTFNGTAGEQVSITMSAAAPGNVDPYLYLLLPSGQQIAENDNGGGGSVARIPPDGFGRLPTTGTYTIIANTVTTSQSGNYSITLTKAATDCPSLPLTLDTTVNGTLSNGDCRLLEDGSFLDAYTFTAAAGAKIAITMTSSTAGLRPVLFLLSPTGVVFEIGSAPAGGGTARIPGAGSFTLPATGSYTVLANSFAAGQTGDYTLALTRSVQPNAHTISGQVTGSGGVGLSGITLTLSGGASATTTTDANGFYAFVEFPAGNNYTITPTNNAQYSFTPRTVSSLQTDQTLNFIAIPHIIISEFRFRGSAGATDEFVELYNQTDQTRDITGWSLVSDGTVLHTISSGSIPARSHYLVTGASYSLPVTSDGALSGDIPDNAAVALFTNDLTFTSGSRLDAAGFSTAGALYIEGGGLSPASGITTDSEHAFVRKLTTGTPQDTDNNSADFVLVATEPLVVGNNAVLGAPGAENRSSPIQRNAAIKGSLIDPQCAGFGAATSGCARVRTAAGANPTTAQYGTLRIRRKFTNTTNNVNLTTLRFRVVGITTLGSPGAGSGQADLRVVSSSPADFNVTLTDGSVVPVRGTQVETPPAQPNGGGLNSAVITITTATPLAPGASVNIEFTLGVQQQGAFSFFVNVEALTAPPNDNALEATKAGAMKRAGSRKGK